MLSRLAAIGVEGHLLWADLSIDTLSHCLATVVRSDVFVASRDVVEAFVANQQSQFAVAISDRERTVLCWLLEGLTQAEVAQKEGLSRRTVERVVTNLEQKFETRSLFALGWKVGRLRLLDEHETSRS